MSLEPDSINVLDLTIRRPKRTGRGGDTIPGDDVLIAGPIPACYQRDQRVVRRANAREIQITDVYFINPGPAVREGDLLEHTDPNGAPLARRQILFVHYAYVGGELDHLELEV